MLRYIVLVAILAGCTTANIGEGAKENQSQRLAIYGAPETVFPAAITAASEMRWEITHSQAPILIQAKTPGNAGRWSDEVSVTLAARADSTIITVNSRLGQKPNRDHITAYLTAVGKNLE